MYIAVHPFLLSLISFMALLHHHRQNSKLACAPCAQKVERIAEPLLHLPSFHLLSPVKIAPFRHTYLKNFGLRLREPTVFRSAS